MIAIASLEKQKRDLATQKYENTLQDITEEYTEKANFFGDLEKAGGIGIGAIAGAKGFYNTFKKVKAKWNKRNKKSKDDADDEGDASKDQEAPEQQEEETPTAEGETDDFGLPLPEQPNIDESQFGEELTNNDFGGTIAELPEEDMADLLPEVPGGAGPGAGADQEIPENPTFEDFEEATKNYNANEVPNDYSFKTDYEPSLEPFRNFPKQNKIAEMDNIYGTNKEADYTDKYYGNKKAYRLKEEYRNQGEDQQQESKVAEPEERDEQPEEQLEGDDGLDERLANLRMVGDDEPEEKYNNPEPQAEEGQPDLPEPQVGETPLAPRTIEDPDNPGQQLQTLEPSGRGSGDVEMTDIGTNQQPSTEGPDPDFTGTGDAEETAETALDTGEEIATGADTALETGLETGGAVAEALGPETFGIGDIIGLIMQGIGFATAGGTAVAGLIGTDDAEKDEQTEANQAKQQELQDLATPPDVAGKFATAPVSSIQRFMQ